MSSTSFRRESVFAGREVGRLLAKKQASKFTMLPLCMWIIKRDWT